MMTSEKSPLRSGKDSGDFVPSLANPDGPLHVYQRAAWICEDAMKGYAVSENGYADHTVAEREAFIHRKRFEALIYKPVLVLSLAMTLFEVPLWCKNGSWWEWESAKVQCPSPDGSHVYFSNLPYMPKGVATIGELLICATLLYLTKDSITSGSKLSHRFSRESYATIAKFRLVVAIAMVVDFLVFLILNNVCNVQVSFRLTGFLRIALFFSGDTMVKTLTNVGYMVREFANVTVLLFGTVLLFAWIAAMALDDLDDDNREGVPINEGFGSIPESLYSLFEASTTQNFPDQMLPTFIWSRWSFVFFFVFMVLTVMIFLNLVLAVTYNAYSESHGDQIKEMFTNRAKGLAEAFRLCTSNNPSGLLTSYDFKALLTCLNRSPVIPFVEHEDVELYWQTLDDDGSGDLSKGEFYDLCDILQFSFKRVPKSGWAKSWAGPGRGWLLDAASPNGSLYKLVRGGGLDHAINVVLTVNSGLVIIESLQDLGDFESGFDADVWAAVEFTFSIVYVAELVVRLSVMSFQEFWADSSNRFDLFATATLFIVGVLWAIPAVDVPAEALRYFSILRMLRLLRLLSQVERFGFICTCIWRMFSASADAIGLLFGCLFIYAVAGVMMFGGLIFDGNDALDDTDYRDSGYDVFNFNDHGLALVSLFANLITGFVPEFYEAYTTVSEHAMFAVCFWVSFYVVGVLASFNIFASLIIDIFLAQYDSQGDEDAVSKEIGSLQIGQDDQSEFKVLTSFKGSDDIYKKMFEEALDDDQEDDTDEDDDEITRHTYQSSSLASGSPATYESSKGSSSRSRGSPGPEGIPEGQGVALTALQSAERSRLLAEQEFALHRKRAATSVAVQEQIAAAARVSEQERQAEITRASAEQAHLLAKQRAIQRERAAAEQANLSAEVRSEVEPSGAGPGAGASASAGASAGAGSGSGSDTDGPPTPVSYRPVKEQIDRIFEERISTKGAGEA